MTAENSQVVVMPNRSVSAVAEEGISRLASAIVQEIVGAYRSGEIQRGDRLYNRLKQLAAT